MDDTLCSNFDVLRMHLPAELGGTSNFEFKKITNFDNYCPSENCNTDLEKITIGFLWLLEQYFTKYPNKGHNVNDIKPFFLYIILWLSHKLNKITDQNFTKINDFYTKHVKNSGKYSNFISDSGRYTNFNEFIEKQKDLLNINIEDLSKFYDASKLICSMYGNVAQNQTDDKLSNNATSFVNKYTELNNIYNNEGAPHSQILSALSTDYNNLKKERDNIPSLPEKKTTQDHVQSSKDNSEQISGQFSEDTSSSSSIGNKLFTVLSIFGAIAFLLGISYKYSLFGLRKRAQKQHLREKIKNTKKRMNH
ncbi:BIR protein [Plasmodium berghei]|uniref:BIR protein n=4 Tax=Plasmodium berghei TaxID=5821 RepID=A0A509AWW6_PLABA|nr:BIR protein [Plasmodium berghei ANKA]SBW38313.1 BIR protein [Plasmodium berghei]VUC58781.1 BIR protein [Plasmodium berghei ANKA]|eukprot:XP_034424504.1 BIR protein [Plasmodium berghei ANKA]